MKKLILVLLLIVSTGQGLAQEPRASLVETVTHRSHTQFRHWLGQARMPIARRPALPSTPLANLVRIIVAPALHLHGRDNNTIIVVYSDEANAFSTARGWIIVTTGLLVQSTDDELLAVVSHELGHFYFHRRYLAAFRAHDLKTEREIELACDAIAEQTMLALHRDPNSAARALAKFIPPAGDDQQDDHPALYKRLAVIREVQAQW